METIIYDTKLLLINSYRGTREYKDTILPVCGFPS